MNKWVRRSLYFIAGIICLLIIAFLFLQTKTAKNIIRTKLQAYISEKTNTEFLIGSLDYRLPAWVELNGVFMRDLSEDTLLFGSRIRADVSMIKLLSARYQVEKIELENMYVNLVKQETDSVFNFQFVVNAFKSKSESTNVTDTALIDLSLKQLMLKNVRFNLLDNKTGSYTRMSVKDLELRVKNLDINKLSFDVEKLYTNELKFQVLLQNKWADTSKVTTAAVWPTINADSVVIKNSFISFEDETNKVKSTNTIGQLQLLGLNNLEYRTLLKGKSIELANSDIRFDHVTEEKIKDKNIVIKDTLIKKEDLGFVVDSLQLVNNKIIYNNNAMPARINGFDYGHFAVSDLKLQALNTSYKNEVFQSTIAGFSFKEKSGFRLDSLSGFVKLDSGIIELKDLYAKTPSSLLQVQATIFPLSLTNSGTSPFGSPQNNIVITNTVLSKKDLELLAESLAKNFGDQLDAVGDLMINADIKGDAGRLFVRHLDARSVSGRPFRVQLSGTVNNISDPKHLQYNLNIANITAGKEFFQPYLENSPTPINWPQLLTARGLLAGNMNLIKTTLQLTSTYGDALVAGTLSNFDNPSQLRYDLNVQARNLETGKWIFSEDQLGRLTGNVHAKGNNGFDIKTSTINTTANISSIRIQDFVFTNIRGKVDLTRGLAKFNLAIKDSKLEGSANGTGNVKTQYPSIDAFLNLQNADLKALGISKTDLLISTLANIDLKNSSPENLEAYFRLDSTRVKTATQEIFSDSALVEAFVRNDSTIIEVISDFADANLASNLNYQQMPVMLNEVLSYYYNTGNKAPAAPPGTLLAYISLKPSAYLQTIVKDLSFKNAQLDAAITNTNRDSAVKANLIAEQLQMGTNNIANLEAVFSGTKDTLLMVMKADTVKAGNILLYNTTARAGFSDNNFTANIAAADAENKPQYALAFDASQNPGGGYSVKLKNGLLLNYDNWKVNENNLVTLRGTAFNIRDFDISNNQQRIALNSNSTVLDSPVLIRIDNFKLSTITAAMNKDSLQLDGLLNAGFTVSDFRQTIPTVDGTLKLDSIIYQNFPVGNLDLKANTTSGQVSVTGKLDGNGNNVDINGRYNANNIDLALNLNPLSLASAQPFTLGNFVRSTGTLTGPINITGSVKNPKWNGTLVLNKVNTTMAAFGTNLKADGQTIVLEYPNIKFNEFIIQDSTGNTAKINGVVTQNSEGSFISDLSLSAKNFTAINNTATDNNFLYGKAIVEMDATLSGDIIYPDLSGNVTVKEGTALTYVQQAIPASLKERDRLMEFIDMDTIADLRLKNKMPEAPGTKKGTRSQGSLTYNLNLEVEPEALLSIILDPATRDELQVKGSAEMNAAVNPNGTVSIAGTYNLKEGSYVLNYGPIQKKFILQQGSTLTMSGDPLNAVVDVTAIYEVNAAALDLIGNEIGGSTAVENNLYRRRVPFQVLLKIQGLISEPQLSFDIVVKDKAEGVSYELSNTINNKLDQLRTDPSLMNKQVFALLAFNRFIGDKSSDFFGGNGLVNSGLLTNSTVSGFLNAAVEQLADDLIKGVDLDLSIESVYDDPSAKHTDLNVSLARGFLDDKLNVTFGKNFVIAGDETSTKAANNSMQFLPDINVTYKLSKDGRYMVRAYRRNQYEAILDGYFIESGLAFSVTMDYGSLKNLLKKKK